MQLLGVLLSFCLLTSGLGNNVRIIGGVDAPMEEYKYMVALFRKGSFICGGSLIKPNVVLTAAHCVSNGDPFLLTAHIKGDSQLKQGVEEHMVGKIIVHENYHSGTIENDIALLILYTESAIEPVELLESGTFYGKDSTVIGWGLRIDEGSRNARPDELSIEDSQKSYEETLRDFHLNQAPENENHEYDGEAQENNDTKLAGTDFETVIATRLQMVTLPIVKKKACNNAYKHRIYDGMVCIGLSKGGKDSCKGDSGGPAIVKGKQYGLVSWGDYCALPKKYGVYTHIPSFIDWIKLHWDQTLAAQASLFGEGLCKSENGGKFKKRGLGIMACTKESPCTEEECQQYCNKNAACVGTEYVHEDEATSGSCRMVFSTIDRVRKKSNAKCFIRDTNGLSCNYKPTGFGHCRTRSGSPGTYSIVCNGKYPCSFEACQSRCDKDYRGCVGFEYAHSGYFAGFCELHYEKVTKVQASATTVCYRRTPKC